VKYGSFPRGRVQRGATFTWFAGTRSECRCRIVFPFADINVSSADVNSGADAHVRGRPPGLPLRRWPAPESTTRARRGRPAQARGPAPPDFRRKSALGKTKKSAPLFRNQGRVPTKEMPKIAASVSAAVSVCCLRAACVCRRNRGTMHAPDRCRGLKKATDPLLPGRGSVSASVSLCFFRAARASKRVPVTMHTPHQCGRLKKAIGPLPHGRSAVSPAEGA
jgi:hypothetical protein